MSVKIQIKDGCFQITIPVKEAYENADLRRFLDFQRVREIVSRSQATDEQIAELADAVKKSWWEENREWFLNATGD